MLYFSCCWSESYGSNSTAMHLLMCQNNLLITSQILFNTSKLSKKLSIIINQFTNSYKLYQRHWLNGIAAYFSFNDLNSNWRIIWIFACFTYPAEIDSIIATCFPLNWHGLAVLLSGTLTVKIYFSLLYSRCTRASIGRIQLTRQSYQFRMGKTVKLLSNRSVCTKHDLLAFRWGLLSFFAFHSILLPFSLLPLSIYLSLANISLCRALSPSFYFRIAISISLASLSLSLSSGLTSPFISLSSFFYLRRSLCKPPLLNSSPSQHISTKRIFFSFTTEWYRNAFKQKEYYWIHNDDIQTQLKANNRIFVVCVFFLHIAKIPKENCYIRKESY